MKVGLGYDFHKGNAATVVINARDSALVNEFARVFLKVNTVKPYELIFSVRALKRHSAAAAKRQIVLACLPRLGKVGIKIVFTVPFAVTRNFAPKRKSRFYGIFHRGFVEHGQYTRKARTNRAAVRIGFAAENVGAGTEYFAFRLKFAMNFKSDGNFVIRSHQPNSFSKVSAAPYSSFSPKERPISCAPMGIPSLSAPQGMLIAGLPMILTGTVNISAR